MQHTQTMAAMLLVLYGPALGNSKYTEMEKQGEVSCLHGLMESERGYYVTAL